ncbi:hypothetical protein [Providencia rettgeri]|uniref:hypothetical protein n=1 Tax=Providencia rettgeri TaxID=587 RepID=UPI000D7D30F9|nr:hypothetical protein AM461_07440 [Providencia rettgeri]
MSLVIIILLIILVPAILFLCLLKKRKWKFWLDESSLHVQPLFWFLVFTPLIISVIAWVLVAQDYELDVSANGYSRLMENAKFPFLILALSPILGAFVTSVHRSLQTDLQIKTAKEQLDEAQHKNKIDRYHSSLKHIYDQLSYISTVYDESLNRPTSLCIKAFKLDNYLIKNRASFPDDINKSIEEYYSLILVLEGFDTFEPFKLLSNDKTSMYRVHHRVRFTDFQMYMSLMKSILFIENKELILVEYDKFIGNLNALNDEFTQVSKDDGKRNALYFEMRLEYFSLCSYTLKSLSDLFNVIREIMTVLYPNEDINDLLPSLQNVEKTNSNLIDGLKDLI